MKAEADLKQALEMTADSRLKASILVMLGNNREMNLQNDKAALDAYQQNLLATGRIGSADQFRSVQGAIRILIREQKYENAFKVMELVKIDDLTGFWRHEMLLSLAQVFAAADQRDQAVKIYRGLLQDSSVSDGHRRAVESALAELTQK